MIPLGDGRVPGCREGDRVAYVPRLVDMAATPSGCAGVHAPGTQNGPAHRIGVRDRCVRTDVGTAVPHIALSSGPRTVCSAEMSVNGM